MSLLLQAGITGVGQRGNLPGVEAADFRRVCHAAARQCGGSVLRFTPAAEGCSFHEAWIMLDRTRVRVLCAGLAPFVAFVSEESTWQPWHFVDAPGLAASLEALGGFRVLSAQEASRPFAAEDLAQLNEGERSTIAYFRPTQIGDALFNRWD